MIRNYVFIWAFTYKAILWSSITKVSLSSKSIIMLWILKTKLISPHSQFVDSLRLPNIIRWTDLGFWKVQDVLDLRSEVSAGNKFWDAIRYSFGKANTLWSWVPCLNNHANPWIFKGTELRGCRGSSVGTATRYGLDGPVIELRWGEIFHTHPDRPWGQGRIKLFGAPRQWKNFGPLFQAVFLSGEGVDITTQTESNTTPPSPKTEITNILFYVLNFASIIKFKM